MSGFVELLSYGFFQKALVASVVIGLVMGLVGTHVVLRNLAFIGAGVAHASFGGIALGLLLGWSPLGMAWGFALLTALGVAYVQERTPIHEDTAIGILFTTLMALGIFGIGFYRGYAGDLLAYLFGNILSIPKEELLWGVAGAGAIVLILLLLSKEFLLIAFDPEFARVAGFPVGLLNALELALMASAVVLSLRLVGVILASALLVIPPATALLVARSFGELQVLSVVFGVGASVVGLFLAYVFNAPSGATVVLCSSLIFFGVLVFQRLPHLKRR